ncbi:GGDEF domain-containing protein [Vibrio vulnificus]|uniref:GGDEF domain-containing protein n=2 Tax=Vibrio vulnificus TaxID=672 RepID=UPI00307ED4B6
MFNESDADFCGLYDLFMTSFPGFLSIRDEEHRLIYLNETFKTWIRKFTDIDVIGLTNEEIAKDLDPNVAEVFQECHDLTISYMYDINTNNKIIKFIEDDVVLYFDIIKFKCEYQGKVYIFTQGKDITKLYNETKNYEIQAVTDELTGLHNRKIFTRLDFKNSDVFIYIDLNNFKIINDVYGHLVGDQILVNFSNILKDSFRKNQDHIIRLGGDEFLVIVDTHDNQINFDEKVEVIRNKFTDFFSHYVDLGFSYGYHRYSINLENTLTIVDKLMYQDKKRKRTI